MTQSKCICVPTMAAILEEQINQMGYNYVQARILAESKAELSIAEPNSGNPALPNSVFLYSFNDRSRLSIGMDSHGVIKTEFKGVLI